jgi:hypothetical protein
MWTPRISYKMYNETHALKSLQECSRILAYPATLKQAMNNMSRLKQFLGFGFEKKVPTAKQLTFFSIARGVMNNNI